MENRPLTLPETLWHSVSQGLRWVLAGIAALIYVTMRTVEKCVLGAAAGVFLALLAASGLFWLAGPRHYPFFVVFCIMVACCLIPVFYGVILRALRYAMRLPNRPSVPSRGAI